VLGVVDMQNYNKFGTMLFRKAWHKKNFSIEITKNDGISHSIFVVMRMSS